jgi:hypothetical protein
MAFHSISKTISVEHCKVYWHIQIDTNIQIRHIKIELVDESSKLIEHHYILNIFQDMQYEMPHVPL